MSDELIEALATIERAAPRVLVWGDVCEDFYRFCRRDGDRFVVESESFFRGMAGAVGKMCDKLGAEVIYEYDNDCCVHERIVCDGKVVSWIEEPIPCVHSDPLFQRRLSRAGCDAIFISDYGRGACTPAGLRQVIDAANAAGVPVLIDPHRQRDWLRYRGATVVKCNKAEFDAMRDAGGADQPPSCVVTNGKFGMVCMSGDDVKLYPADAIDSPTDTTGAGDQVLAVLGVCLAAGIDLATACRLANVAAGIKCGLYGPRPVSLADIREAVGAGVLSRLGQPNL